VGGGGPPRCLLGPEIAIWRTIMFDFLILGGMLVGLTMVIVGTWLVIRDTAWARARRRRADRARWQ
jgi:hypothetical protein